MKRYVHPNYGKTILTRRLNNGIRRYQAGSGWVSNLSYLGFESRVFYHFKTNSGPGAFSLKIN